MATATTATSVTTFSPAKLAERTVRRRALEGNGSAGTRPPMSRRSATAQVLPQEIDRAAQRIGDDVTPSAVVGAESVVGTCPRDRGSVICLHS